MNQRLLSVFIFALVVSAAASFLIYRLVSNNAAPSASVSVSNVVVAARDLEIGALIGPGDVRKVAFAGPVPSDVFAKPEDLTGRGVVTKIFKDEPIVAGRIAPRGAGAGLAATIPMGMRAVALRVNDVVGLAGFVLPGMRVDVVVSGNAPGAEQNRYGTVSRTVLQNLEVLSANQRIERNVAGKPEDAQVVNLLVTPDQAEVLNLASLEAKVQLVLRNPLDQTERQTRGSSTAGLFGGGPLPASVQPAALRAFPVAASSHRARMVSTAAATPTQLVSVEVFSGGKRTEQQFESRPEAR